MSYRYPPGNDHTSPFKPALSSRWFSFSTGGTCYCSSLESIHAWLYDIIYRKWLSISLSSSIRPAWKRKHKSLTVTLGDGDGVGPQKEILVNGIFLQMAKKTRKNRWLVNISYFPPRIYEYCIHIHTHTHTLCESKPCLNKRVRLKSIGFFHSHPRFESQPNRCFTTV